MEISCIILAGGKSVRYGQDKILETFGAKTLLETVISHTDQFAKEIIIVTSKERTFARVAGRPKIRIVNDIVPGQGSLGGIYTGLVNSKSLYNLVLAADMPFLNEALLRYMINAARNYDYTLPRLADRYEPLHAVYSTRCTGPIDTMLKRGEKMIINLFNFKELKVRYLQEAEIDRFDPQHLSFFNINTREDMARARMIQGEAGAAC